MNILSGADLSFYLITHGDGQTADDVLTLGKAYMAGISAKSITEANLDAVHRILKIIMSSDQPTRLKLVADLRALVS